MSKYQQQFEEAIQFGHELFGSDSVTNKSANPHAARIMQDDEFNAKTHEFINIMVDMFLSDRRYLIGKDPSFQCHVVSQQFKEFVDNWKGGEIVCSIADLRLTVGNILYKGNNIYQLNKKKLKEIVKEGHALTKSLDLHVWLTASDMTVYDLTIIPTLKELGYGMQSDEISEYKVWNQDDKKGFDYVPLLVDDKFSRRVDIFS